MSMKPWQSSILIKYSQIFKSLYYLAILLGLLWIYGYNDLEAGSFIYANF